MPINSGYNAGTFGNVQRKEEPDPLAQAFGILSSYLGAKADITKEDMTGQRARLLQGIQSGQLAVDMAGGLSAIPKEEQPTYMTAKTAQQKVEQQGENKAYESSGKYYEQLADKIRIENLLALAGIQAQPNQGGFLSDLNLMKIESGLVQNKESFVRDMDRDTFIGLLGEKYKIHGVDAERIAKKVYGR